MKNIILTVIIFFMIHISFAQQTDTTENMQPKYQKQQSLEKQQKPKADFKRIFYGGSVGFSFGSYTSVRIYPMIGYRITPKLSTGLKLQYEFSKYHTGNHEYTYHNYGASIFSRFRFIPQAYIHAEFNIMNYETYTVTSENSYYSVPFLFLGGGFVQRLGGHTYAYAEILFDVLNDKNSPYNEWTPFYTVGVSVGF